MTSDPRAVPHQEGPRRAAYAALLACSTLGTLSSTIISAPINVIAESVGASASGIVLAVSAFTLSMVLFAPASGWLCQRFGSRLVLGSSLAVMMLAGVGASLSQDLTQLVLMRALQGLGCSAIPTAVQQVLGRHWPENRARVMAAWASAIGVGQAIGPPIGGLIADGLGWRWVFVTHASLSLLLLALVVALVPPVAPSPTRLHVSGLMTLVVGVGSLVGAFAWAGQHRSWGVGVAFVVVGAVALLLHGMIARRSERAFVDPGHLADPRYLASTAAAGTVMCALGVAITATPLHLGRDVGLGPGHIGLMMLTLAVPLTLFAPITSRLSERFTAVRTLRVGLVVMSAALVGLGVAFALDQDSLLLTAVLLAVTGCAIGAGQATSAHVLMTSSAASHGTALGVSNMIRFAGLAVGYSWVAATWSPDRLLLVYSAPVVLIAATWLLAGAARSDRPDHTGRTSPAPERTLVDDTH
ncbi:multidrug efflux MFS transporter [Nocardioides sp. JQ2195]|uniref:MFS transporter n=1 Tax=Nocardioides sp. JQ2195 TaxID=2592334 RepID=UPI00143E53A7|nr:MFS transporter [Nocardioides sp. JQ2195]QIX25559.1 multidrug efflux MFS transporter [Nocardioides sp. JQ2195]